MSLDAETIKKLRELAEAATPGPWSVFIDDSGTGQWTGWPLSIYADAIEDKTIVRPGGLWPYEWDAKTSQHEANANAAFIAAANPAVIISLIDALDTQGSRTEAMRKALEPFAKVGDLIAGPFGPALFRGEDDAFQSGCAWTENGEKKTLTWGDFRRARAALSEGRTDA